MPSPISTRVWKGSQSWEFEDILRLEDGQKLAIRIKRDSYDHQSYARVDRWDGAKWQLVVSNTIGECVCQKISYVADKVTAADFKVDADRLFCIAKEIVS